jgi:copper resistance protein B
MRRLALIALAPLAVAGPALAQASDPHAGHAGHETSPAAPDPGRQAPAPAAPPAAEDPHAGHRMPAPAAPAPADPHAGHGPAAATGADQPVGTAPPPAPVRDNAADRVYGEAPMARGRAILEAEHGGMGVSKIMLNIAEYASAPEGGGYRWDVEGWWGGDVNRLVVKSEGEGGGDEGLESGEVQALWSRAVGRYTDLQVGVRHDFEPGELTYATVGVETLFPYWFEAEAALFLSEEGHLSARLEGSYDLRLTQRLVLQPRAEFELAADDEPQIGVGKGFSSAELGLRLRYEIRREFAPYIGVSYERSFGRTADFARAEGEDVERASFVAGLRAWF